MYRIGLSSTLDLNATFNGGAPDEGLNYVAVGDCFTVNQTTGVVSPVKTGMGVVLVKNSANNQIVRKIPVSIIEDSEASSVVNANATVNVIGSAGGGGGSSVNFVDQEEVSFDANGSYTLQNASSGISAGSIPLLTFDGVVQDGASAGKRFAVINDANGNKRKLQLYYPQAVLNAFTSANGAMITDPGVSKISRMTSNSSAGQVASVSSTYSGSGYEAYRLVDKNYTDNESIWASATVMSAQNPQWWQIDLGEAKTFQKIRMTARHWYTHEHPVNFEIRGSNDAMATYDVLVSASGVSWTANEVKEFENSNPTTAYRYVRLHVTAVSSGSVVSLKEIDFVNSGTPSLYVNNVSKRNLTATDTALALGSGDFTVEAWIRPESFDGYNQIIGATDDNTFSFGVGSADGLYLFAGGWAVRAGSWENALVKNMWNHVAVVRSGTTLKTYINGVFIASGTSSTNFSFTTWVIGDSGAADADDRSFPGSIRNVRITKAARYTTNFTPFAVTENVESINDLAYDTTTVLRASLSELASGNFTWKPSAPLLPAAGTISLVSYRTN